MLTDHERRASISFRDSGHCLSYLIIKSMGCLLIYSVTVPGLIWVRHIWISYINTKR